MQAAFVEVGLEKAGFIHVSDLFGGPLPSGFFEEDDSEDAALDDIPEEDQVEASPEPEPNGRRAGGAQRRGRRERFTSHIPKFCKRCLHD